MSATSDLQALYQQYVLNTYGKPSLALVRGAGARVWDAEGREYLDFLAGIAVTVVGHCHPRLVAAIREQAGRLMHVSNLYANDQQPRLAETLVRLSGLGGKVFFCNSGAEANEGLIKLARLWGHDQGRYEVITFRNSFHGRTLATLTATGQDKVQKGFEPLPAGFRYARYNDLDSVRAALTPHTAAVLVEAVQGEGGVLPADPAFLAGLRALCTEKNLLLLCDEVQCGIGRTGRWFGFQHYDLEPDAFSLAKGLGGGFPIGAFVTHKRLADVYQPGHHGSTFGGTPLACAAARAVLEIIESENLVAEAACLGARLKSGLTDIAAAHPWLEGARGLGLMLGLVANVPVKPLETALIQQGLITLATAERVLRFLPPLIITADDVDRALDLVAAACRAWQPT